MRVLIACEFSGIVRTAFEKRGHFALSCDYKDTLIPGNHYQGDVLDILCFGWDLMIAHPPCTYLAVSGMHRTVRKLRDPELTEQALDFVKKLMDAPIEKIAIENPVSVISTRIRKPDQIVQPYQFGHDVSKKTCFWYKNLPKLSLGKYIEPRLICCGNVVTIENKCLCCFGRNKPKLRWGNQTDSGQNNLPPKENRADIRSITYRGIAEEMANSWG